MAVEDALQAERNKALNRIRDIVNGSYDYCWQEETLYDALTSALENTFRDLDRNCKAIKEKYRQKEEQSERDRGLS